MVKGPVRVLKAEALRLERKLFNLVNAAYGLAPEEVALMWRTTPPRMPVPPLPWQQHGANAEAAD